MWHEVHEAFQATFQKTSIACFYVFWIQYLFCVHASVPHCAVYRETVTSSLGRWRLLIFHCILTSVTCTSLCWTGCVCRGRREEGYKEEEGVCVQLCVCGFRRWGWRMLGMCGRRQHERRRGLSPNWLCFPKSNPNPLCVWISTEPQTPHVRLSQ